MSAKKRTIEPAGDDGEYKSAIDSLNGFVWAYGRRKGSFPKMGSNEISTDIGNFCDADEPADNPYSLRRPLVMLDNFDEKVQIKRNIKELEQRQKKRSCGGFHE